MPVLHEKSHAVLFGLNRERRCDLNRLDAAHVQFVTARRAIVLSQLAGHDQRRFLGQTRRDRELLLADGLLAHDRLHVPRSIPHGKKMELPAVAAASQPSTERHFLSHVPSGAFDRNHRHRRHPPSRPRIAMQPIRLHGPVQEREVRSFH